MREDSAAWIVRGTAGAVRLGALRLSNSNEHCIVRGFSSVQTGLGGTRSLSSQFGDLCGRSPGIATIIFTKSPSEVFGAVLRLGVMVPLVAIRSHGGALPRIRGRPVWGAR